MRNYALALLLLCQNAAPIFSQNQADSLLRINQSLPDDTAKIRTWYQQARWLEEFNLDANIRFLKNGKQLAQQLTAARWLPDFDLQIGRNHANQDRPDSALFYFNASRQGYEKLGDQRGVAATFSKIGWVYNYLGDYEKAQQVDLESLSQYEKLGDERGIASSLNELGQVLYSQDKFQESADIYQKAYDLNKKLGRPEWVAVAAQGIGFAYLQLGMREKALEIQNEALKIRRELGSPIDIGISLNARGNALKYLKRYPEALRDYQDCVKLAQESGHSALESSCAGNVGHVLNLLGRFRESLPIHLEQRKMVEKTGRLDNAVENLALLSEAYAGLGRFDSAYHFKEMQRQLADSLLNVDNQKRMSELQTKYETSQKEAQIARQGEQLVSEKKQFWAVAAGLILALLGGGLLFRLSQKLRQRNAEKEFLIKEIHHRVKNNLQVLSSLLHLQSRGITDETALDAVREGQNRVDAMGLIHQKLYMGDNLAAVKMRDYLQNLGDTLLDSFGLDGRVSIAYKLEPLRLDVDTAIPLGLIINELLTNSMKYGFQNGQSGNVEIALWKNDAGKLCLRVADNGAGKNADVDAKTSTGFGAKLIQLLSQKLKGKPEVVADENGYATSIEFENFKLA